MIHVGWRGCRYFVALPPEAIVRIAQPGNPDMGPGPHNRPFISTCPDRHGLVLRLLDSYAPRLPQGVRLERPPRTEALALRTEP